MAYAGRHSASCGARLSILDDAAARNNVIRGGYTEPTDEIDTACACDVVCSTLGP